MQLQILLSLGIVMLLTFLAKSLAFVKPSPNILGHRIYRLKMSNTNKYSIADQAFRFANAQKENNARVLDIEGSGVYKPEYVRDKVVLVTGEYKHQRGDTD